jgi:hypothetical protein
MSQNKLLNRIAAIATKLEIRQSVIISLLKNISSDKKYTSKELVRKSGLPKIHLYRLLHEFTDILEKNPKHLSLKKENSKEIKIEIKKIIKQYQKIRPQPNRNLDQFTATANTTAKRILKLIQNDDLIGKKIAFLGDDDLTSIAAAQSRLCQSVTLFEIDNRLIKLSQDIAKKENLEIEIVTQDLKRSINKKYISHFDIVFTDPPYTKEGTNLFLNQAINLIKKNFLGRIYLCYGNSDRAREREIEIQKLILDHGLLIKSKFDQFNSYYGAQSIGSQSSLYILDWTPKTKTLKINSQKIYTNE